MRDIQIKTRDLVKACKLIAPVRIEWIDPDFAILETTHQQRTRLWLEDIKWDFKS